MLPRSVTSRRSTARRNAACAASDARSGARRRSTSEAMSVATTRSSAGDGLGRAAAQAQPADGARPRRAARRVSTPGAPAISARSSAEERAATARTALERSMTTSDASSARAAARTTSGSPQARLDGVRDRLERPRSDRADPRRQGSFASVAVGAPGHDRRCRHRRRTGVRLCALAAPLRRGRCGPEPAEGKRRRTSPTQHERARGRTRDTNAAGRARSQRRKRFQAGHGSSTTISRPSAMTARTRRRRSVGDLVLRHRRRIVAHVSDDERRDAAEREDRGAEPDARRARR